MSDFASGWAVFGASRAEIEAAVRSLQICAWVSPKTKGAFAVFPRDDPEMRGGHFSRAIPAATVVAIETGDDCPFAIDVFRAGGPLLTLRLNHYEDRRALLMRHLDRVAAFLPGKRKPVVSSSDAKSVSENMYRLLGLPIGYNNYENLWNHRAQCRDREAGWIHIGTDGVVTDGADLDALVKDRSAKDRERAMKERAANVERAEWLSVFEEFPWLIIYEEQYLPAAIKLLDEDRPLVHRYIYRWLTDSGERIPEGMHTKLVARLKSRANSDPDAKKTLDEIEEIGAADHQVARGQERQRSSEPQQVAVGDYRELSRSFARAPSFPSRSAHPNEGFIDLSQCVSAQEWLDARRQIDPRKASTELIAELVRTIEGVRFAGEGELATVVRESAAMLLGKALAAQEGKAAALAFLSAARDRASGPIARDAWEIACTAAGTSVAPRSRT